MITKEEIEKRLNQHGQHHFWCKDCDKTFLPDLLQDKPGHRVKLVVISFFPPRETGGDWSPVGETSTMIAECPDCKKETSFIKEPDNKPKAAP